MVIDEEKSNVSIGDVVKIGDRDDLVFTVISPQYAMLQGCINWPEEYDNCELVESSLFNEDYCFDDESADYESSKIKARVDEWFKTQVKPNL